MKKILIALAITGSAFCNANAQTNQMAVGTSSGKVCRPSSDKKNTYCYATKYAENYKVCKNYNGYFICGESPGHFNSTYPRYTAIDAQPYQQQQPYQFGNTRAAAAQPQPDMTVPQSQSYTTNTNTVTGIGTLYSNKNYIRMCYGGDNVAEDNRMPYQGCPSPQYDGPDKNNNRNVNESNPVNLPPIQGRK